MNIRETLPGHEAWLEAGLVLFAAGLLVGLGVLAFGKVAGSAEHGAQHARPAPSAGSVPEQRHQHISSNAAR